MLYRDIYFVKVHTPPAERAAFAPVRSFCDVIAVNETKLAIMKFKLMVMIFNIRKDGNKFGGGVCLYITNQFNYTVRNDLMPEQLENIIIETRS